jgi:hypothetical protein
MMCFKAISSPSDDLEKCKKFETEVLTAVKMLMVVFLVVKMEVKHW